MIAAIHRWLFAGRFCGKPESILVHSRYRMTITRLLVETLMRPHGDRTVEIPPEAKAMIGVMKDDPPLRDFRLHHRHALELHAQIGAVFFDLLTNSLSRCSHSDVIVKDANWQLQDLIGLVASWNLGKTGTSLRDKPSRA